jgi:hypothetical protein
MAAECAYARLYGPIEGRYKPIESLVLSIGGITRYRPKGGLQGSYRIDLHGRTLVVDPRDDYINDLDTLLAPDDTLKPDAFWLLTRLFERCGVPLILDTPAGEAWEAGRTEWQRRDWREFWAALRGAGAPYPECNGYTLAELVRIWHGSPEDAPASMNMRTFLRRCRDGKPGG